MKRCARSSESTRSHTEPFGSVSRRDAELLHEGAVLAEHLDAVVGAVADIDEPVVRQPHAMHGVGEAARQAAPRVVGRQLVVVRLFAVGAPVPLVGAGLGVEHDDAAVAVAVGDVELAGRIVGHHVRGPAELVRVALEPPAAPGLPICSRNLPSGVNFRIWWSSLPLPASQTLPSRSTWMPCSFSGQS